VKNLHISRRDNGDYTRFPVPVRELSYRRAARSRLFPSAAGFSDYAVDSTLDSRARAWKLTILLSARRIRAPRGFTSGVQRALLSVFLFVTPRSRPCRKQRHLTYATVFRGDEYTRTRSVGARGRVEDRRFIARRTRVLLRFPFSLFPPVASTTRLSRAV